MRNVIVAIGVEKGIFACQIVPLKVKLKGTEMSKKEGR